MSESELFREIDEEVRKEKFQKLARRLAPAAIGIALVVALAVGGWFGWQAWRNAQADDHARAFVSAVGKFRGGDATAAADDLAVLAGEASGGYRALALLQRAAALEDGGFDAAAMESYRQLVAEPEVAPDLRAIARLRAALLAVVTGADPDRVRQDLGPLLTGGAPYQPLAAEVEAAALLQSGDREAAISAYKALAAEASAQPGVRQRADEALRALGVEPGGTDGDGAAADPAGGEAAAGESGTTSATD